MKSTTLLCTAVLLCVFVALLVPCQAEERAVLKNTAATKVATDQHIRKKGDSDAEEEDEDEESDEEGEEDEESSASTMSDHQIEVQIEIGKGARAEEDEDSEFSGPDDKFMQPKLDDARQAAAYEANPADCTVNCDAQVAVNREAAGPVALSDTLGDLDSGMYSVPGSQTEALPPPLLTIDMPQGYEEMEQRAHPHHGPPVDPCWAKEGQKAECHKGVPTHPTVDPTAPSNVAVTLAPPPPPPSTPADNKTTPAPATPPASATLLASLQALWQDVLTEAANTEKMFKQTLANVTLSTDTARTDSSKVDAFSSRARVITAKAQAESFKDVETLALAVDEAIRNLHLCSQHVGEIATLRAANVDASSTQFKQANTVLETDCEHWIDLSKSSSAQLATASASPAGSSLRFRSRRADETLSAKQKATTLKLEQQIATLQAEQAQQLKIQQQSLQQLQMLEKKSLLQQHQQQQDKLLLEQKLQDQQHDQTMKLLQQQQQQQQQQQLLQVQQQQQHVQALQQLQQAKSKDCLSRKQVQPGVVYSWDDDTADDCEENDGLEYAWSPLPAWQAPTPGCCGPTQPDQSTDCGCTKCPCIQSSCGCSSCPCTHTQCGSYTCPSNVPGSPLLHPILHIDWKTWCGCGQCPCDASSYSLSPYTRGNGPPSNFTSNVIAEMWQRSARRGAVYRDMEKHQAHLVALERLERAMRFQYAQLQRQHGDLREAVESNKNLIKEFDLSYVDKLWQTNRRKMAYQCGCKVCPCPDHCMNGIMDVEELGVDCGGQCMSCDELEDVGLMKDLIGMKLTRGEELDMLKENEQIKMAEKLIREKTREQNARLGVGGPSLQKAYQRALSTNMQVIQHLQTQEAQLDQQQRKGQGQRDEAIQRVTSGRGQVVPESRGGEQTGSAPTETEQTGSGRTNTGGEANGITNLPDIQLAPLVTLTRKTPLPAPVTLDPLLQPRTTRHFAAFNPTSTDGADAESPVKGTNTTDSAPPLTVPTGSPPASLVDGLLQFVGPKIAQSTGVTSDLLAAQILQEQQRTNQLLQQLTSAQRTSQLSGGASLDADDVKRLLEPLLASSGPMHVDERTAEAARPETLEMYKEQYQHLEDEMASEQSRKRTELEKLETMKTEEAADKALAIEESGRKKALREQTEKKKAQSEVEEQHKQREKILTKQEEAEKQLLATPEPAANATVSDFDKLVAAGEELWRLDATLLPASFKMIIPLPSRNELERAGFSLSSFADYNKEATQKVLAKHGLRLDQLGEVDAALKKAGSRSPSKASTVAPVAGGVAALSSTARDARTSLVKLGTELRAAQTELARLGKTKKLLPFGVRTLTDDGLKDARAKVKKLTDQLAAKKAEAKAILASLEEKGHALGSQQSQDSGPFAAVQKKALLTVKQDEADTAAALASVASDSSEKEKFIAEETSAANEAKELKDASGGTEASESVSHLAFASSDSSSAETVSDSTSVSVSSPTSESASPSTSAPSVSASESSTASLASGSASTAATNSSASNTTSSDTSLESSSIPPADD